jgi:hypothetical protein
VEELQNAAGFGFEDGFHDQLPTAIEDGDHLPTRVPKKGDPRTFWGRGNFCPNSAQQAITGSNKTAQNDTAQKLQAIVTARYCRSWVEW